MNSSQGWLSLLLGASELKNLHNLLDEAIESIILRSSKLPEESKLSIEQQLAAFQQQSDGWDIVEDEINAAAGPNQYPALNAAADSAAKEVKLALLELASPGVISDSISNLKYQVKQVVEAWDGKAQTQVNQIEVKTEVNALFNRLLKPTTNLLFHPQTGTRNLHIYSIDSSSFWKVQIDMEFLQFRAFTQVEDTLYLAGGFSPELMKDDNIFYSVTGKGKRLSYKPMPTGKRHFPLHYNNKRQAFYTIGGHSLQSKPSLLSETTVYYKQKEAWDKISPYPYGLYGSSLCLLEPGILYNLGGHKSPWSIGRLALGQKEWIGITIASEDFTGWQYRSATVIDNAIVYFGSFNSKATYILSEENEQLEAKKEDGTVDLATHRDCAWRVYGEHIFATSAHKEVFRFHHLEWERVCQEY